MEEEVEEEVDRDAEIEATHISTKGNESAPSGARLHFPLGAKRKKRKEIKNEKRKKKRGRPLCHQGPRFPLRFLFVPRVLLVLHVLLLFFVVCLDSCPPSSYWLFSFVSLFSCFSALIKLIGPIFNWSNVL